MLIKKKKDESSSSDSEDDDLDGFEEDGTKKKNTLCKKFLRFLFSWLGLFLLCAAYTVGGAYYFHLAETPLEEHRFEIMMAKANDIDDAINYMIDRLDYITFDTYGKFNNCSVFVEDVYYEPNQKKYSDVCLDQNNPSVLNSPFCNCVWLYRQSFEEEASSNMYQLAAYLIRSVDEANYRQHPKTHEPIWDWRWTFTNALLFTMTTLTLIGYGHVSPSTDSLKIQVMIYAIVGLPIMMTFLANIGGVLSKATTNTYSRLCCRWCRVRRKKSEIGDDDSKPLTLSGDMAPKETYMPTGNVIVPIMLVLCLMTSYVMFGAAIYVQWEDWDLLDAAYFTFITLTTIGFGDYVPGSGFLFSDESDNSLVAKLIFTTFYCLLGLALIAMGIEVMQLHVMSKKEYIAGDGDERTADMDRYIMTKHYNVKETPADKTGNKLNFNRKSSAKDRKKNSSDDFDSIEEAEIQSLSEFEGLIEPESQGLIDPNSTSGLTKVEG